MLPEIDVGLVTAQHLLQPKFRVQHVLICSVLSIQVETPYYIEHRFGSTGHHHSPAIQFGGWTDQLDTEWGSQTLRQACYRENPKAQCAFKILMIHEVLQFALRIAFRCVLHRCGNLDIHR